MNIYESISAIMQEIPAIGKEKRNQQQGFMYRGIDDVMNVLQPLLAKHKVFVVPEVLEQTREERTTGRGGTLLYSLLKVRYTFCAEDGSCVSAVVIGEGMDSGDKASNKAMAVALKYAFFQLFCIPTEEMVDPDSETPEPSKPKGTEAPRPPKQPEQPCQCERCGREIKDAKSANGDVWKAKDIAVYTKLKFDKRMCGSCYNQEMTRLNAVQMGEGHENAG